MSFLTPLYLLGALAIALPILAHLIRRTPPRRREFSSVMFLAPSLPKVTRRSRIENWPLLCLRALVIGLLAFAFARPLWRTPVVAEDQANARWAAVLLDTSASLRRDGQWEAALQQLDAVLNEYGPADRVGVFTFDTESRLIWSWEAWAAQDPAQRTAAVAAVLERTTPTWRGTDLAQALITAAESLENEAGLQSRTAPQEVVVITDFQKGGQLSGLQGYVWPEEIPVRVVQIGANAPPDNAGIHPATAPRGSVRVQVTNADGAAAEAFQIRYADVDSSASSSTSIAPAAETVSTTAHPEHIDVVVPAGQRRVVGAPTAPDGLAAATLVLVGDDHPFDNACYVVVPQRQKLAIVYLGADEPDDPAGHRFYVAPLFADTPQRDVEIVDWAPTESALPAADAPVRLVLLTALPAPAQVPALQDFVRRGGLIIDVLRTPNDAAGLALIAETSPIPATEAEVDGFSLLTDIDFAHPALAAFADPKFSDFTTLHFWKHRRLDVRAIPQLRVLARFDDGDVAVGEIPLGDGRIVFLTSGWSRDDSQLAVWSKFVPLMNGLLETTVPTAGEGRQLIVGDVLPWRALGSSPTDALTLRRPDGTTASLTADGDDVRAELPGFYTVTSGTDAGPRATFAVNLPASESDTAPLGAEQLEALGIPLEAQERVASVAAATRQDVANAEIEQGQRLWRWVLLAAIVLLAIETLWAGRLTRRDAAAG